MSLQSLALSTALFQSTPPVKAATASLLQSLGGDTISIHAAREGGDIRKLRDRRRAGRFQSTPPVKAATSSSDTMHTRTAISIHAAREGGDCITDLRQHSTAAFQSTPPVKAATCPRGMNLFLHQDFNPRRP